MPVLVDTNIIIDVVTDDPDWANWSIRQLDANAADGLVINPVIYAELCFGFPAVEGVDDLVKEFGLSYQDVPRPGLFRAAKAFAVYKSRGGAKESVLPDFFVGGHAEATGLPVLTRDTARFRTYFPTVRLICPD
ncbi:MAG: DNA-binding protein [Lentisphaerae bacterium RIFOXYB12_FULL_65_16]|nr:MAG: DNA-binding protein [Lentisphaerae bacterium RIFOXYA12_64_32]OGV88317.1 MAG: DNA-binding protein [Lentisphaerae bacterium RIFOXYB12_FULL_65_16]